MTKESNATAGARRRPGDSAPADAGGNFLGGFDEHDRFEAGASRYADYLQTVEGRLRLDLAWMNLSDVLKHFEAGSGRALDVGGGTGALALRLASSGWEVTVVDSSASMLALAAEGARRAGGVAGGRVSFKQAEASGVAALFGADSFDLVVCHNVVEYVTDAAALTRSLAEVARPGAHVSVLARNRAGEVLRDAIKLHDLDAARNALTAEEVRESLYGGPARVFDARSLRALAEDAGLEVVAERGVRVVADYLPAAFFAVEGAYERLLDFEHDIGARPEFAAVARYTQIVARAS